MGLRFRDRNVRGLCGCRIRGFVPFGCVCGGARFTHRNHNRLFLMQLRQRDGPGGRLIGAAGGRLVETEGLKRSGESEEEQCRADEDSDVEMEFPEEFEDCGWQT
jgi:hypothetical protein